MYIKLSIFYFGYNVIVNIRSHLIIGPQSC